MTLADLKSQLDHAVEAEDYDLAARIRDALQCVCSIRCDAVAEWMPQRVRAWEWPACRHVHLD
jgi:hypothetical protein